MPAPLMQVRRGLKIPRKTGGKRQTYDFDVLKHGDAIEVRSIDSCRECFRRWRKRQRRPGAQLIRSRTPGQERLLFFIDERREDIV